MMSEAKGDAEEEKQRGATAEAGKAGRTSSRRNDFSMPAYEAFARCYRAYEGDSSDGH